MKVFDKDFYATKHDQVANILSFEAEVKLQYVQEGMFNAPQPTIYYSVAQIPKVGSAEHGDYNHTPTYLVNEAGTEVNIKEEPQQAGGVLYAIDLRRNRTAFFFQPSGHFDSRTIITGSLGTATGNKTSLALCKRFWLAFKKGYVKVGRFYVGPEAYRLLEQGARLTPSVQCPPHMDLRIGAQ